MIEVSVLFTPERRAITADKINERIKHFKYVKATQKIILDSWKLDRQGKIFTKCASFILSNFGMTRGGRFKDYEEKIKILHECWDEIGDRLIKIHGLVVERGLSGRDRFLLELGESVREEVIAETWLITKKILPLTMGDTSYGLVGASKILFAVLPEIVLPIDNSQWLHVFKTVDLGDVINRMTVEIQRWENATGKKLNEIDCTRRLTTLPAVYNVMAMAARPSPDSKVARK